MSCQGPGECWQSQVWHAAIWQRVGACERALDDEIHLLWVDVHVKQI